MQRISVTIVRTARNQDMGIAGWRLVRPVHYRSRLHIDLQAENQHDIDKTTVDRLTRNRPGLLRAMGVTIVSVKWSGNCATIVVGSQTTDLGELSPARIAQVAECIFASAA